MSASPNWRVWSLRVKDRYADNGVVGVAIAKVEGEVCEIDSFLMSCRVIGRTLETAFLARLASDAREQGATLLEGWFLPTKKNAPAREFYPGHGFEVAQRTGEGVLWRFDLSRQTIVPPAWISVT
jgi:FkbH-like protein